MKISVYLLGRKVLIIYTSISEIYQLKDVNNTESDQLETCFRNAEKKNYYYPLNNSKNDETKSRILLFKSTAI